MRQLFHTGRWQAYWVIGALVVALMAGGSNPLAAAGPGEDREVPGMTMTAKIVAKHPEYIVAADENGHKQRLEVYSETMIQKADGTRTALEYLIVPCTAHIETFGSREDKIGVRKIEVMETSPTGTSHWSTPPPE
ncbi:MAG: hypothetical protein ACLFS7_03855 [Desulfosudaceae bacterium]